MNYYEELGLTPEATPEEIHQAHRRLTKLLHPDQQTDEMMRRLAETQMRRLNSIVDILSDKDSRKQYDKTFNAAPERPRYTPSPHPAAASIHIPTDDERPGARQVANTIWRYLPWWVWSTVGALTLTSAAVWFFADNLGSSFSDNSMAYVPVQDQGSQSPSGASVGPPPETRESQAAARLQQLTARLKGVFETKPETPPQPATESATRTPAVTPQPGKTRDSQPSRLEESPQATLPPPPSVKPEQNDPPRPHETESTLARLTPPKLDTNPISSAPPPVVQPPTLPKPANQPAPSSPPVAQQNQAMVASIPPTSATAEPAVRSNRSGLEGEWIYAPKKAEKRKPGLYPPAFIEMKLVRAQGGLKGSYRARYQVDEDRQISPEVKFEISSPIEDSKTLSWEGDNGSKGWMKVNTVDKYTIKVEWKTTVYSNQPCLTAGVATLVRR